MSEFEHCPCPLCGQDSPEIFFKAPDRFELANGPAFQIQRCKQCDMVYLSPRPTEAGSGRYYQHEAYLPFSSLSSNPTITERLYDSLRRYNLRWKQKMIERFKPQGELLDVGCGTGELLAHMRGAGWKVRGLERDPAAVAWGNESLNLSIEAGSITDLKNYSAQFDVITLWHVLEHLYSPAEAFRILKSRLKPEGLLIIAVPNIASFDSKIYRSHWIALDTPRHVNHFSLKTLTQLAGQNGFTRIWQQQLPLDAFFNTFMSERLLATANNSSALLWPLKLFRAGFVTLVSLLIGNRFFFVRKQGGASSVVVFKKSSPSEKSHSERNVVK